MIKPQRRHYQSYYIQQGDTHIPCTHEECFAPGEPPSEVNPYKQCWYYAEDFSQAVRLERSAKGYECYKINASSLKDIERQEEVNKDMVELDRYRESEDGFPFGFEIPCPANVEKTVMRVIELRLLDAALKTVSEEHRKLWDLVIAGKKKKDIAKHYGITVDGVRYRENRLHSHLRSDKALKNWFVKS